MIGLLSFTEGFIVFVLLGSTEVLRRYRICVVYGILCFLAFFGEYGWEVVVFEERRWEVVFFGEFGWEVVSESSRCSESISGSVTGIL